jgi:hypothetical protein
MGDHEVDRLAMQRDAALVHALATRTLPPGDVDLDDPIVTHLAVWVDWIDAGVRDGVGGATPLELAGGKDRVVAIDSHRRRRPNRAAMVAGGAVVALVVSSGAAAAVTGDPFLVAKAPFEALQKVNPFSSDGDTEQNARDQLPDHAPDVAKANKLLADAQRVAAHGNFEKAQRLVEEAKAMLGDRIDAGQQHRLDHLTEVVAVGTGQTDGTTGQPGNSGGGHDHGQPSDPGSQSGDHSQKPDDTGKTDKADTTKDHGDKGDGTVDNTDRDGTAIGGQPDDPPGTTDHSGTGDSPGDQTPKGQSSGKGTKADKGGAGGGSGNGAQSGASDAAPDRHSSHR